MDEAHQYFNSRGWRSHGIPATDTGKGGTTGGFLVLHGNFVVQLYQRTGEALQSPLNAEILAELLSYLSQLNALFIVGGDWQNEPEALAATVIQSKFKAQILDTQGCHTVPWRSPFGVIALQFRYNNSGDSHQLREFSNFQLLGPAFGKMMGPCTSWARPSLDLNRILPDGQRRLRST